MKKLLVLFIVYPVFLFSGVFEHLLGKDTNYLFERHFQCSHSICISQEKNIFDDAFMDNSIRVVRSFLDDNGRVFKVELELTLNDEEKNSFYEAIVLSSNKPNEIGYSLATINDKYGNHNIVTISDIARKDRYKKYLTERYYKIMKNYTDEK